MTPPWGLARGSGLGYCAPNFTSSQALVYNESRAQLSQGEIMVEPRQLLGLIPHGLYLIGVQTDTDRFIYTSSWLTQASFEPCLIVTAVRQNHPGSAMIQEAGAFSVNFLAAGQLDLARGNRRPGRDRHDRLPGMSAREVGRRRRPRPRNCRGCDRRALPPGRAAQHSRHAVDVLVKMRNEE